MVLFSCNERIDKVNQFLSRFSILALYIIKQTKKGHSYHIDWVLMGFEIHNLWILFMVETLLRLEVKFKL